MGPPFSEGAARVPATKCPASCRGNASKRLSLELVLCLFSKVALIPDVCLPRTLFWFQTEYDQPFYLKESLPFRGGTMQTVKGHLACVKKENQA